MKRRCGALLLMVSLLAESLAARTLYVDDDAPGDLAPGTIVVSDPKEDGSKDHPFDSIQEAIDAAASSGDTIVVAPGHYLSADPWEYDEIKFKGKDIRLISSAPTDFSVTERTVLCGVVVFQGDEPAGCLLQGFKIQNYGHGGVLGNKTQASLSHCIISGNGPCGATVIKDVWGRISNCLIVDNTTFFHCGLLPVISGFTELANCTVANNATGVWVGQSCVIHNCIIYGNGGPQIMVTDQTRWRPSMTIDHCLIENWTSPELRGTDRAIKDCDPCFVQPGQWVGSGTASTLIEGNYRLRSAGWRWTEREVHGSYWLFDPSTSQAVDAGDPMDSLGEEPERVPVDLEGRWGVNHAIDMGAYGGTSQGGLSPTKGSAPGIGAVDLRDYWPFAMHNAWSANYSTDSRPAWQSIELSPRDANGFEAYSVLIDFVHIAYCVFINDGLYVTRDYAALGALPQIRESVELRYPQFLTVGATMSLPDFPLAVSPATTQPVTILRGSLEQVHAGVAYDPNLYLSGPWPDVIAFRLCHADGTLGEPTAIFAHGFGPLMLSGQAVKGALIEGGRERYSKD